MWRAVAWSLPHRLGHIALTILAVALGFGSVVAVLGLNSMVRSTADGIVAGTTSDVTVVPTGSLAATNAVTSTQLVTDENLADIAALPGVKSVHGQIRGGDIFPVDADGNVIEGQLTPTLAGNYIAVAQTDDRPRIGIATGRAPATPGEVAIDAETLARSGHAVGDRMVFARPGIAGPTSATIVGVLTLGSGRTAGATYALFSDDAARALFLADKPGWNGAWVEADDDADLKELAAAVEELLPRGFDVVDSGTAADATKYQVHPLLGFSQLGLWVAGVLLLLVALMVIRTITSHLIAHRRTELARLRRLGASRGQVGLVVVAEQLLLGFIGALLAIPVGLWMAGLVQELLANRGYTLGGAEPKLRGLEQLLLLTVGPVLAVLCSRAFIRRAMAAAPLPERPVLLRRATRFGDAGWTGLGLLLAGVAVLVLVDRMPTLPRLPLWAGVGATAVLAGAVLAVPVLGWPLVRGLGGLTQLGLRDAGRLTTRSILQNPGRFSRAAAALVLGTGLVATFAILAQSGRTSAAELIPAGLPADLVVTSTGTGGFSRDVAVELAAVPGVRTVSSIGFRTAIDDGDARSVVTADPGALERVIDITVDDGRAPRAIDEVMVDSTFAASRTLKVGRTLPLVINQTDAVVRVVGIYVTPPGVDAGEMVSLRETFVSRGVPDVDSMVALDVTGSTAAAQAGATKVAAANPLLQVRTPEEIATARGDRLSAITSALDSLLGLVAVASVVGVTYMLVVSASERRREFTTLRRVGAADWQVGAMVALESLIMATVGALVGTVAGVLAGWGLVRGFAGEGYGAFEVEWGRMFGLVWLGFLVGLAAAVLPTAWAVWSSRPGHRRRLLSWPLSQGSADRGAESAATADPQT